MGRDAELLDRFARTVAEPDPALDLSLALIAAVGRDGVAPDGVIGHLDELAGSVAAGDAGGLCEELFAPSGPHRFAGDRSDYHDPRNSWLDQVLERRLGLPISLSVVAVEVGRRIGIDVRGIGMPGHFLLGDPIGGGLYDPFDEGRRLTVADARERFRSLHGDRVRFDPAHLATSSNRSIVERVLANLHNAAALRGDRALLVTTLRLRDVASGGAAAVRAELAAALALAGRFDEAAEVHEALARSEPDAAEAHLRAAVAARARLN